MRIFKDNSFRILLVIFVLFLALPLLFTEPSSTPVGKGASYKEGELMSSSSALPVSSNPFKAMLDGYFDKFSKFYKLPFAANTVKNQMGTSAILFNTEEDARAFVNAQTGRGGEPSAGGVGGGEEGPLPVRQMREVGRVYLDGTDYFPVMSDGSSYMVYTPQGMVPYDLFASDYVPQEDIEKARAMAPGLSDDEIALALKTIGLNEYLSAVARDGHENTYNRLTKMLDINPQAFGYGYAAPDGRGAFGGPSFGGGGSYAMGGTGSFGGGSGGSGAIIIGGGDTDMAGELAQKYSSASSGFKGVGRVYDPKVLAQGAGKDGKQDDGKDVFAQFGEPRLAGSEKGQTKIGGKEGKFFTANTDKKIVLRPLDQEISKEMGQIMGLGGKDPKQIPLIVLPDRFDIGFGPGIEVDKANRGYQEDEIFEEWEKSDKEYLSACSKISNDIEGLDFTPSIVMVDGNKQGNLIAIEGSFYGQLLEGLFNRKNISNIDIKLVKMAPAIVEDKDENGKAINRKTEVPVIDTKKLEKMKSTTIIFVRSKEEKKLLEDNGYTYVIDWNYAVTPEKLNKNVYEPLQAAVADMLEKKEANTKKAQKLLESVKEEKLN